MHPSFFAAAACVILTLGATFQAEARFPRSVTPWAVGTRPPNDFSLRVNGPVEFFLEDVAGNRTGWDPQTGARTDFIPGSGYGDEAIEDSERSWFAYVLGPSREPYTLQVLGIGQGQLYMSISFTDAQWGLSRSILRGYVLPGREYTYRLTYSPEPGASRVEAVTYAFGGFLPPLDAENARPFKLGSTVPVRFRLARADGGFHGDVRAELLIRRSAENAPPGEPLDATPAGATNQGNLFRYDPAEDLYVYNLSTKGMGPGMWELTVRLDDGAEHTVGFGLQ
ncbi:MAG: PxKF domain-containing protein [Deferrisomatales bacterium]|nr:PxKF domain-containing protein [Deferrisomatales bacterium]